MNKSLCFTLIVIELLIVKFNLIQLIVDVIGFFIFLFIRFIIIRINILIVSMINTCRCFLNLTKTFLAIKIFLT